MRKFSKYSLVEVLNRMGIRCSLIELMAKASKASLGEYCQLEHDPVTGEIVLIDDGAMTRDDIIKLAERYSVETSVFSGEDVITELSRYGRSCPHMILGFSHEDLSLNPYQEDDEPPERRKEPDCSAPISSVFVYEGKYAGNNEGKFEDLVLTIEDMSVPIGGDHRYKHITYEQLQAMMRRTNIDICCFSEKVVYQYRCGFGLPY